MITKSSFKDLLIFLDFSHENNVFEKNFPHLNATMSADFSKGKLIFPEQIKGRERNDSFNSPENFVVFECVHHLLNKGYRPEHIELEKEWHLGHDSKSGRADICVTDEYGSMLFIIECKTWGKEFDNAFKDTELDGGQLFSYWQQEQSCKWLVLYSSNFNEGLYEYNAPTIKCSDDPNIELLAKNDKSIKLFLHASTVKEKHEAWKETYGSSVYDDLIFSSDSVAYNIGVKPLLKKDLRDFSLMTKS